MTYKQFLNATSIALLVSFFLPWIVVPLFGGQISAMTILGHSQELNNPLVNIFYFFPVIGLVMLICNQKTSILNDVLIAFAETFSILILVIGLFLLILQSSQSYFNIFDILGIGAYLTIAALGVFSYDMFAHQMKKYEVREPIETTEETPEVSK